MSLSQGKKLPSTVEEAKDDEGEVSDEDEAADMDQEELSKIQPQPKEGATSTAETAEASGEQVHITYPVNVTRDFSRSCSCKHE